MTKLIAAMSVCLLALTACGTSESGNAHRADSGDAATLPIIGEKEVINGDTVYHTVGDWSFYRQDSALVTEDMLQGTAYVADFFFTSCPTICPRVTANMLRIRARFGEREGFRLVSFTVDPRRDSVGHLQNYAANLGVTEANDWWFLTGDKFKLYEIADDYFSVALESDDAPGGFDHSGRILFVDEKGRIRAFANGTEEEDVNQLMEDIDRYFSGDAQ